MPNSYPVAPPLSPPTPFMLTQPDRPQGDADWLLLAEDQFAGRCSLWWKNTPTYAHHRVGLIGHYQMQNAIAAPVLLQHACQQLADRGCTLAIAPMDGHSWQRYRCIIERGSEPPFFLEPDYDEPIAHQFTGQGFEPIAHYHSALNLDLTYRDSRSQPIQQRLQDIGITIRSLNLNDLDTELRQLYQIATIGFRHNLLYMPIPEAEFLAQYRALLPHIKPELVFLAVQQQRPIGFLFAVPNWLEVQRSELLQTIILKTIAVLPDRRYAGLGQVLFEHCHATAYQMGFRQAIYALIHDGSECSNLVRRYATPMRRYALFAKVL